MLARNRGMDVGDNNPSLDLVFVVRGAAFFSVVQIGCGSDYASLRKGEHPRSKSRQLTPAYLEEGFLI
jgi:hypothetical protein